MTKERTSYNVIVLVHTKGDITIADMAAIDAYAVTNTDETAQELQERLETEAYDKYGRDVSIYIQPYYFR